MVNSQVDVSPHELLDYLLVGGCQHGIALVVEDEGLLVDCKEGHMLTHPSLYHLNIIKDTRFSGRFASTSTTSSIKVEERKD
jgi:hypothetical protein